MSKKSVNVVSFLYLIGMALTLIGCFLPLSTAFGKNVNGNSAFYYLQKISNGGVLPLASLLTILGAAAGIVLSFIAIKKAGLFKLISLVVSVAGGILVIFNYNNSSKLAKGILKGATKVASMHMGIGLYLIIAGWIIALVGWILYRK